MFLTRLLGHIVSSCRVACLLVQVGLAKAFPRRVRDMSVPAHFWVVMGALSSERAGAVAFDIFESSMSCGGELRVSLAFYKHLAYVIPRK